MPFSRLMASDKWHEHHCSGTSEDEVVNLVNYAAMAGPLMCFSSDLGLFWRVPRAWIESRGRPLGLDEFMETKHVLLGGV